MHCSASQCIAQCQGNILYKIILKSLNFVSIFILLINVWDMAIYITEMDSSLVDPIW